MMARILVAEDEEDIRELIAFALTNLRDFEVIAVSNGFEALEKAETESPDLIILDVKMPRMSGYEVCTELKGSKKTANIPVVFLSARGQEGEIKEGLKVGGLEYILKPFAPEDLCKRVTRILNDHNTL
jgi:two-component system alkaline phosphatase synthesis response regulator PhoP